MICSNIEEVMKLSFVGNVWFIGGKEIYKSAMNLVDTIHITVVPLLSKNLHIKQEEKILFPSIDEGAFKRNSIKHPYNDDMMVIKYDRK
jgi:dihydrofolate reductase